MGGVLPVGRTCSDSAPPISPSLSIPETFLLFFFLLFCSSAYTFEFVRVSLCVFTHWREGGTVGRRTGEKKNRRATFSVSVGLLTRDGCGELLLSLPFLLLFPLIISSDERKKKRKIFSYLFCFSIQPAQFGGFLTPTDDRESYKNPPHLHSDWMVSFLIIMIIINKEWLAFVK